MKIVDNQGLLLSVVIPVYNAENSLNALYHRLIPVIETITLRFEIILVEDCSQDDSWRIIENLAKVDSRVRGFQLSRNFGQHAATICGVAKTHGLWVVTLDDDLEHHPESIIDLYAKAKDGCDLVYGVFAERSHMNWRNCTSTIARFLFKKAIPSLNHSYSSFRLIRGDIARVLPQFDSPYPFVDGYLSWITNRCRVVELPHGVRAHGSSNYTFRKLFVHSINIFVSFSDLPLRLASWTGLTFFFVGMTWLFVIVVGRVFSLITVSGFASIMAAIVLFGGIQLLILGIFGEYLGRMNFKASHKPLYLIARITANNCDE